MVSEDLAGAKLGMMPDHAMKKNIQEAALMKSGPHSAGLALSVAHTPEHFLINQSDQQMYCIPSSSMTFCP